MSYEVNVLTEYILTCDCCGEEVVFHSGADKYGSYTCSLNSDIKSLRDALRTANFHRCKNKNYIPGSTMPKHIILCDKCYNERLK